MDNATAEQRRVLDEIARRAGLGNATVDRYFSDRAELIRHIVLPGRD